MRRSLVLLPILLLAACGSGRDDTGGTSPDEQRQLNDAAAMLDANNAVPADNSASADNQGNAQ